VVAEEVATMTVATVATGTVTTAEATTVDTVMTAEATTADTVTTVEDTTADTAMTVEATTAGTETLTVAELTVTPLLDAMTATAVVEEARDSTVLLLAMRLRPAAMARVRVTIPCPAMVVTELSRCRPPCALSRIPSCVALRYSVHGRSSRLLWSCGVCTPGSFSSFMGKGVGRISKKEHFATEEFYTALH
jgi:hypothetical protein